LLDGMMWKMCITFMKLSVFFVLFDLSLKSNSNIQIKSNEYNCEIFNSLKYV
jgi:hypothetical protein